MLLKRLYDDNESTVAPKRFKIGKTSENIRAWTWNGMEQEDVRNIGAGKMSECGKMSEKCGKHQKHQSVE